MFRQAFSTSPISEPTSFTSEAMTTTQPDFEVFFDGQCPICVKEINFLRWLDRRHRITFTDIAAPDFDLSGTAPSYADLMSQIHGRGADGRFVVGVEVFRQLYGRVGFGFLIWFTRLTPVSWCLESAYSVFARNRLRWTGRCDESCRKPVPEA